MYIELKLECTRNRSWEVHKSRDDWLCLYCARTFPSKLRLTDHQVGGCPRGPLDSKGSRWELPIYPNLKTTKQCKDLKLALERGDGFDPENINKERGFLNSLSPKIDIVLLQEYKLRRHAQDNLGARFFPGCTSWIFEVEPGERNWLNPNAAGKWKVGILLAHKYAGFVRTTGPYTVM